MRWTAKHAGEEPVRLNMACIPGQARHVKRGCIGRDVPTHMEIHAQFDELGLQIGVRNVQAHCGLCLVLPK